MLHAPSLTPPTRARAAVALLLAAALGALALLPPWPLTLAPPMQPAPAAPPSLNVLAPTSAGLLLTNPRHRAGFTPQGVAFVPQRGGPAWQWRLESVLAGGSPAAGVDVGPVAPVDAGAGLVRYRRGALDEQYVARERTVEQQFVIARPLGAPGDDVEIAGAVASAGAFRAADDGWVWQDRAGTVRLGGVFVYDASGARIPAAMEATAGSTRIVVDGAALATARYPVTVDPEIGANDFRISQTLPDGDRSVRAKWPSIAYNSQVGEYLVVWDRGAYSPLALDQEPVPPFDRTGELNVVAGQRITAATGAEVGADFVISSPTAALTDTARRPAVAYGSVRDEYLVVWHADPLNPNDSDIYGQRLTSAGGLAGPVIRISSMGVDAPTDPLDGQFAAVTYNSVDDEYLVIWLGEATDGEWEVYGRIVDGDGTVLGADEFRVSTMGTDGSGSFDAGRAGAGSGREFVDPPAATYNPAQNEYMAVWFGDDNQNGQVDNDLEVFGRRIDSGGALIDADDVRISQTGANGSTQYSARFPDVAYGAGRYLVAWQGEGPGVGGMVDGEFETFGQLIDAASGSPVGGATRLSQTGPDGDNDYNTNQPDLVFMQPAGEFLVVWQADDDSGLMNNEAETYGQRVEPVTGKPVGADDFRLSNMDLDGTPEYDALSTQVAYNGNDDEAMLVWYGDTSFGDLVDEEYEIYGQRLRFDRLNLDITDQKTLRNTPSKPITFALGNADNPPEGLSASYSSSNTTLVPNANIVVSGSGSQRTLVITPAPNQVGQTTITVTITRLADGTVLDTEDFTLTVEAPPAGAVAEWLVLLYLAGDDVPPTSGGSTALTGLSEPLLTLVGDLATLDNPNVQLVVLYDGSVNGDTRLYTRAPGAPAGLTPQTPAAGLWPGFGPELNTGSMATLRSFVRWARLTYPGARHTMLSVVDHGGGWAPDFGGVPQPGGGTRVQAGGWRGLSLDATSGVTSLSTRETGQALDGLGRFDVLFFDACLMGGLESLYEVSPYADYVVAGQNLLFAEFPYLRYLAADLLNTTVTPREVAQGIVERYNPSGGQPLAIAAVDTSRLAEVRADAHALAAALLGELLAPERAAAARAALFDSYRLAQKFDYDASLSIDGDTDGYVDLSDFARKIRAANLSPAVNAAADGLAAAIGGRGEAGRAVVALRRQSGVFDGQTWDFTNAYGISVYLPLGERDCRPTGVLGVPTQGPRACPDEPSLVDGIGTERQMYYYTNCDGGACLQMDYTRKADVTEVNWGDLLLQLEPYVTTKRNLTVRPFAASFPIAPTYLVYTPLTQR